MKMGKQWVALLVKPRNLVFSPQGPVFVRCSGLCKNSTEVNGMRNVDSVPAV